MVLFGKIVFLHVRDSQHKATKVVRILGVVLNEVQMVFGFIIYFAAVRIVVMLSVSKLGIFANENIREQTHMNGEKMIRNAALLTACVYI